MSRASMSEDGEFLDINWEESDCCTLTVRVHKPSNHEELVAALLFAAMEFHRDRGGPNHEPRIISSTDEWRHLAFVPWKAATK